MPSLKLPHIQTQPEVAIPLRAVALATCEEFRYLSDDDRLLVEAFERLGIKANAVVWSDPSVRWESFSVVVLRSTWDYFRDPQRFLKWVDLVNDRSFLINFATLLRWNIHKSYLFDLAERGIDIVPTKLAPARGRTSVAAFYDAFETESIVIKPAISASSDRVSVLLQEDLVHGRAQAAFEELQSSGDVLVQPYLDEVYEPGERSLILLNGRYSHAVYRVPFSKGINFDSPQGSAIAASQREIDFATRVLSCLPVTPAYARVDLIPLSTGKLVLSELELIEPSLYFAQASGSAWRFVHAICDQWISHRLRKATAQ